LNGRPLQCCIAIQYQRFPISIVKSMSLKSLVWFPALLLFAFISPSAQSVDDLHRQFQTPPDEARIMMRWWWFGPTVTKPELEREMRLMKDGGIGGFEIQPIYPVVLEDASKGLKTLPFLSDEFLDALKFTQEKARELGLRVDLTIGSGWPFGGPSVPVTEAAGRLRVERVKANTRRVPMPPIAEGEKLLAVFSGTREITELRDGAAWLPDNTSTEVMFFIASRTGQQVKRPGVGGEGFVLDHYSRPAIDNYLKNVGDRLLQGFMGNPPYAIFCDSLEVFSSDWTSDFLAEFQKRRGYDLKPLLPALVTDIGPQTASIRHDWGQTMTELLNERFMIPMRDWAKRNNTKFRIQGYGIPPATIGSNAYADITEGEGSHWKTLRAARWASSANHLYGRNITTSETWTWLHSPSFRATPLDLKAEADLHFLQGINQLIGHGWPYTAEGQEYPGWRLYAAGAFNEKNPWWIVMPDLSKYLQRVSWLLRQGQPSNDIAFYLPNSDAWAGFVSPKVHYMIEALKSRIGDPVIARTLEAGYNLDFFDDDVLQQIGKVEKGALSLGANKYKAVILPNVERIPLATLRKLEEFAKNGGIVVAARRIPNVAPGYKATDAERAEIRAIAARLFEGANAAGHFVADETTQLAPKLNALLTPDVKLAPAIADIGFIHRHAENADIYFLANSSNQSHRVNATFRVQGLNAELWNPLDGSVIAAAIQATTNSTTLSLELEPYGSRVVIFSKRALSKSTMATATNFAPLDLSSGWRVTIGQQQMTMDKLRSWTEGEAMRFFSGAVTYEKNFTLPDALLPAGQEVRLDFGTGQAIPEQPRRNGMRAWFDGPVREAAVVYVNEQRAGSVWCPPYSLNVTKLVKRGENRLRIVVANTAINYLAGRRLPDYKLLTLRYGDRFQPQDMENLQPLPSGLLGTVQLVGTTQK
jgi:alpha-L-rhamnosidase